MKAAGSISSTATCSVGVLGVGVSAGGEGVVGMGEGDLAWNTAVDPEVGRGPGVNVTDSGEDSKAESVVEAGEEGVLAVATDANAETATGPVGVGEGGVDEVATDPEQPALKVTDSAGDAESSEKAGEIEEKAVEAGVEAIEQVEEAGEDFFLSRA